MDINKITNQDFKSMTKEEKQSLMMALAAWLLTSGAIRLLGTALVMAGKLGSSLERIGDKGLAVAFLPVESDQSWTWTDETPEDFK